MSNSGGQAFPLLTGYSGEKTAYMSGLSKRDYFAATALNALLVHDGRPMDSTGLVEACFRIADSMLKTAGYTE